jgi:hypothetical protein
VSDQAPASPGPRTDPCYVSNGVEAERCAAIAFGGAISVVARQSVDDGFVLVGDPGEQLVVPAMPSHREPNEATEPAKCILSQQKSRGVWDVQVEVFIAVEVRVDVTSPHWNRHTFTASPTQACTCTCPSTVPPRSVRRAGVSLTDTPTTTPRFLPSAVVTPLARG